MPQEQAQAHSTPQATSDSTGTGGKPGAPRSGGGTGTGGKPGGPTSQVGPGTPQAGGKSSGGGSPPSGGGKGSGSSPPGGAPQQGGKPGGSPFSSGAGGFQPGQGFFDFNPRDIAGLNSFQTGAGGLATGMPGAGQGYMDAASQLYGSMAGGQGFMNQAVNESGALTGLPGTGSEAMDLYRSIPGLASQQVTGANIDQDPAIRAAQDKLKNVVAPMIADSAGLQGLGTSSAVGNAMGKVSAETMLPLIQDAMGREERGIDRAIGGTMSSAGGLMGGAGMESQNLLSRLGILQNAEQMGQQGTQAAAQGMQGLGQFDLQRLAQSIGTIGGLGGQYRDVEQQQLNAPYEEQMRLFSEGLNSVYGPFNMVSGMMGATSTQGGGGKK